MENKRQTPVTGAATRPNGRPEFQPERQQREGDAQPVRRGPFTYAAGWLGGAFDRDRLTKQQAQERRSRNW